MIKYLVRFVLVSVGFVLLACSTKPDKNYQVTTLQSISYSILDLADRKRQLQEYEQALLLYREAERYALKRNDKYTVGLAQLKRAAIYIQLAKPDLARELITGVEHMVDYERVPLSPAVKLLRAQLAQLTGDTAAAIGLLTELQQHYLANPEKYHYYQFVAWSYQTSAVPIEKIQQGMELLRKRKRERTLMNIEIYSYAVYQYLSYLVENNEDETTRVLEEALAHFSDIELSNKIVDCYRLASLFYKARQRPDKAQYFDQQAENLVTLLKQG